MRGHPPKPAAARTVSAEETEFRLSSIAIPAYGPSVLYGTANGAILPVIALSARELGASVAQAGLIVALIGIASLLSNIPAALITSRYGERRAIVGAAILSVFALLLCIMAPTVLALAGGVYVVGTAASVFLLARQSYLIESVPAYMRARALSTLGGTNRIGVFIGPFLGAGLIHLIGLSGGYWVAVGAMALAAVIAYFSPDLVHEDESGADGKPAKPRLLEVVRGHKRVLATLGIGILLVSALRSSRQVVIPLWADHLGVNPTTASLLYGFVAAIDMAVFYPAGMVMDRRGRLWVALPCTLLMGLALIGTAFTTQVMSFVLVALVLGFGNGIGSGIVMTLGADSSPRTGRTEFLGVWRVIADFGTSMGPVLLSAFTAIASLAAGVAATGFLGLIAAVVFWRWLPRTGPAPRPR
jgi:MFS family permease